MSDWSEQHAKRFLRKQEEDRKKAEKDAEAAITRDKKFVREQEILQKRSPDMWSDLCDLFAVECKDFNSAVRQDVVSCKQTSANILEISRIGEKLNVTLSFDPQTNSIKIHSLYDGLGDVKRLDIKIESETSDPRFWDDAGRLVPDPAAIVQRIIEQITS